MDACLETGVAYLDTANYEPLEEANMLMAGNGLILIDLKRPDLQQFLDAVSTRGLHPFIPLMLQNTILMRFIILT